MKKCTRFHFEDVERGDALFLGDGSTQEFNDAPDPDVTIIVAKAYRSTNFGEVVVDVNGQTYYLDDYRIVREAT